jgi:putative addiction module component (TIGR02574 family)
MGYVPQKSGTVFVFLNVESLWATWYNDGMSQLARQNILNLSVSERIQLVEDIWDSIAEIPESISLTEEQKRELDRRLDAYHKNPEKISPWHEVQQRIQKRA